MAYGLTQSAGLVAASSQYFSAVNSASLNVSGGNFTLETWVKFTSLPGSDLRYGLISKGDLATFAGEMAFQLWNDTGTYKLVLYYSNGANTALSSEVAWTPSTGTWYHVAATHDTSGNVKFYINGTQQGITQTGSPGTSIDSGVGVKLGAYFVSGNPVSLLDGRLSLARVWFTVLSQATISANICNVYGTATGSMAAEWSLNNVLTDASGNSNTLTNNNGATFTTDVPATCTAVVATGRDGRLLTMLGVG